MIKTIIGFIQTKIEFIQTKIEHFNQSNRWNIMTYGKKLFHTKLLAKQSNGLVLWLSGFNSMHAKDTEIRKYLNKCHAKLIIKCSWMLFSTFLRLF